MQPDTLPVFEEDKYHISPDAVNADDRVNMINYSNTFGIFDRWGNIYPQGRVVHGIYHEGTRFLNKLVLDINGYRPLLLSSTITEDNTIHSVHLTNPILPACDILDNTIHISRNQFLGEGVFYEEINCVQYGEKECSIKLTLSFNGDFKDIFEIRGIKRRVNVNKVAQSHSKNSCTLHYEGLDGISRKSVLTVTTEADFVLKETSATIFIQLKPGERITVYYSIQFITGSTIPVTTSYAEAENSIRKALHASRKPFADIYTSNQQFNHWINRSKSDLISLLAQTDKGTYPYAGVPWYNTPFGRDGIITAMETLWLNPEISKNVLLFLAATQATELIPEKDAEPGKILHEARRGEMANTGEVPFKEYYGTIDATPLFIMLAGMYYERTADIALIRQLWPNIKAALIWIDIYGDIDGDGFVEYKNKAENGLTNQGWKDSFDSVMYEDGTLAEAPIALCEVQGYVYAAKNHAAKLAHALGEPELSAALITQARQLKKQFNAQFWDEQLKCYVLALDGKKRPCRVISSNAGHCLFTKIATNDKAAKLADTLLSRNMFAGWGVRTLSADEKKYNPMSYHNGSIWPHDNSLIVYGLSLYNLHEHAGKITKAIFEASLFIDLQRMPELYCGFDRRPYEGPTAYPVACSPQAWSVAVVFMLLQACLRIEVNALKKTIVFDKPQLPAYVNEIIIDHLILNGQNFNLRMTLHEHDVSLQLIQKPRDWEVIMKK